MTCSLAVRGRTEARRRLRPARRDRGPEWQRLTRARAGAGGLTDVTGGRSRPRPG